MPETLIDRIYEAAFVPELWTDTLGRLTKASSAASGSMMVFDGFKPVGVKATDMLRESLEAFISEDEWRFCPRVPRFQADPTPGFVHGQGSFPHALTDDDPTSTRIRALGLDCQAGTIIPLPSGEIVAFTFERHAGHGCHARESIAFLNTMHRHLARAGLMAARLKLEKARGTVAALQAVDLAAAVLAMSGRVMAVNALFEAMPTTFLSLAGGGMAIADESANALFKQAIEGLHGREPTVQSIPVPAREDRPASIIHVLPLRRSAHDIFSGAEILIAATVPSPSAMVPSPQVLHGLFDLTPAETRLALALASGQSLKQAAARNGNQFSTARSQLETVFRKTGTNKQGQLVALLKSTAPLTRQ